MKQTISNVWRLSGQVSIVVLDTCSRERCRCQSPSPDSCGDECLSWHERRMRQRILAKQTRVGVQSARNWNQRNQFLSCHGPLNLSLSCPHVETHFRLCLQASTSKSNPAHQNMSWRIMHPNHSKGPFTYIDWPPEFQPPQGIKICQSQTGRV